MCVHVCGVYICGRSEYSVYRRPIVYNTHTVPNVTGVRPCGPMHRPDRLAWRSAVRQTSHSVGRRDARSSAKLTLQSTCHPPGTDDPRATVHGPPPRAPQARSERPGRACAAMSAQRPVSHPTYIPRYTYRSQTLCNSSLVGAAILYSDMNLETASQRPEKKTSTAGSLSAHSRNLA